MLLDSAEAVLSIFGFSRSIFGFDERKAQLGGIRFIDSVREILRQQEQSCKMGLV
jgi:hypothetical protein